MALMFVLGEYMERVGVLGWERWIVGGNFSTERV